MHSVIKGKKVALDYEFRVSCSPKICLQCPPVEVNLKHLNLRLTVGSTQQQWERVAQWVIHLWCRARAHSRWWWFTIICWLYSQCLPGAHLIYAGYILAELHRTFAEIMLNLQNNCLHKLTHCAWCFELGGWMGEGGSYPPTLWNGEA